MQHNAAPPSSGGPRFRIVPGPMIGESPRSTSRNPTLTSSASTPAFSSQYNGNQDDRSQSNQGTPQQQQQHQQQQISVAQVRQPVQYVVVSQGGGAVPMNEINGNVSVMPVMVQQQPPQQQQQQQPQPQPQQQQSHAAPTQNATRTSNPAEQASMVSKCARFFKTLIHLSQQPDQQQGQQTAHRVTELVKLVIYGSMPPEDFTGRLQEALRSQAQPHLLPFLQKTLPALRAALQNGEVVIEGIEPPQQSQPGTPSQPAEVQQQTQWDNSQHHVNNENVYVRQNGPPSVSGMQQMIITSQPITVVKTVDTSGEESQVETAEVLTSENEVRLLPADHSAYRLLNGDVISRKIQRALPDSGPAHDDVVTLISHAAEYRLRGILTQLSVIAEHRLEPLRNHPFYKTIDDTRRQLRFIEDLDRREWERNEHREKEALIRLSKSKGRDKDSLVEKAKQLQRADQEAARNRDANAAAIAALGGTKTVKRTWTDANNPFEQPVSAGLAPPTHRPRTKRVTMRDLQLVLSTDPVARSSPLRFRLSLFNSPNDGNGTTA